MTEVATPTVDSETTRLRLRRFIYLAAITLATAVSTAAVLKSRPLQSANDRSRWCTVWSLVERQTYEIDEIIQQPGWDTIDKVYYKKHFYSSKPPLLPVMVAGVYRGVKQLTGWNLLDDTLQVTRLILLLINVLPMIGALILLAIMAERYAKTDVAKTYTVIAASFATLLTTFLVTLNNHTVAAYSVVFALFATVRILADGRRQGFYFAMAGFFAAFTCTNELPAALFGLILFGLLFRTSAKQTIRFFIPLALLPLGAFFYTNYLATGGWKPFYAYYGSEIYRYTFEGIPSYWMDPKGIDRSVDSTWVYFLNCTIGHHGILSLSPIFLLALFTWANFKRWRQSPLRPVLWLGLLLSVAVLAFFLTRTANYNYGGKSAGLRWMFWLIPFWLLAMIPTLDQCGHRLSFRITAVLLLLISTFSAAYPLHNPWQHPWLFEVMQAQGWIDYSDPPPPKLDPPLTTWFRSLPDSPDPNQPDWIEFTGVDAHGKSITLRLIDAQHIDFQGRTLRRITVDRHQENAPRHESHYHIDPKSFTNGAPPAKFLHWPAGKPAPPELEEAKAFLRGLPKARKYRPGVIRYVKTALRTDAFRCQRAAAQVSFRPTNTDEELRFRTDIWLCDNVPFGVLQIITTISNPKTNVVLTQQRLTATAASRILKTK